VLNPSRIISKPGTTSAVIAGNSAGVRVLCSPLALPIYNSLVDLAKTNHWARLVVSGISSLSSGRLHMDNIFVKTGAGLAYGRGAFYVVLPGVTATFELLDNGSYILQHIKADSNYLELQKASQRPGLWRVDKNADIKPEFQQDGMILNKEYRSVMIPDMATDDVRKVAQAARADLNRTNDTVKHMVEMNGFDLHHTPGTSGIVGLKKARDAMACEKDKDIVNSATLLANTMFKARHINGVLWYSDWGGSAVLTRALLILHNEKGIKLDNHAIFMNRPTSSPKQAIELAEKVGIKPLGAGRKTGLRLDEIRGHIIYTDITLVGTLKTTGFGVSAAGAAFGFTGASLTTSGVVGLAGAMFFLGTMVNAGTKNLKAKQYK